MYPAAQVLVGVAIVIFSVTILLLVQRKAFGHASVKAGPVSIDLEAKKKIEDLHAEVKPNGGSTMRDAIDRIEKKVNGQTEALDGLNSRVEALEGKVT